MVDIYVRRETRLNAWLAKIPDEAFKTRGWMERLLTLWLETRPMPDLWFFLRTLDREAERRRNLRRKTRTR